MATRRYMLPHKRSPEVVEYLVTAGSDVNLNELDPKDFAAIAEAEDDDNPNWIPEQEASRRQ